MGIIVLSVAILPMFGLGGMQLYSAEVTGVSYEKLSPRIADTAKHMWLTYIVLTIGEGVLLWLFGMGGFDAVCHSMATISTGGFATHNDSVIGYTPAIQWIIMLFMLLSGINFTQLIYAFRGKPQRLFQDEETRWYICACFVAGLILMGGLLSVTHGHLSSIRIGFFTAVATITSTGFVAADYMIWPPILWVIVFFLMFRRCIWFDCRRYEMGSFGYLRQVRRCGNQTPYTSKRCDTRSIQRAYAPRADNE